MKDRLFYRKPQEYLITDKHVRTLTVICLSILGSVYIIINIITPFAESPLCQQYIYLLSQLLQYVLSLA